MMRVCVIGSGLVGSELGRLLRAEGDTVVVGTTTTAERVESLRSVFDDVRVVRGSDAAAVADAATGCDAIVVTAGPNARRAMAPEERAATYREVLVDTAESVVAVPFDGPIVALSSLSVYGDAADGCAIFSEEAPLTGADDPSPRMFQAMESVYLDRAAGRACVFRCADIYGSTDPPLVEKIRMAHTILKGSLPFAAQSLFYRVDVRDVAAAVAFAVRHRLTGVYNLTHAEVPPTNQACFDAVSAELGLPALQYRGEVVGPARPISVERLAEAGFRPKFTVAERLPETV